MRLKTIMRARFELQDCRGRPIVSVILPCVYRPDYADCDYAAKHAGRVLDAAGVRQFVCDGCYDHFYRVKFLGGR